MHEAGLAQSVIECCTAELQARGGGRVTVVGLRIGALASVDVEAFRFCFDALKQDTPLCSAVLAIDHIGAGAPFDEATALDLRYLEFDTEVQS